MTGKTNVSFRRSERYHVAWETMRRMSMKDKGKRLDSGVVSPIEGRDVGVRKAEHQEGSACFWGKTNVLTVNCADGRGARPEKGSKTVPFVREVGTCLLWLLMSLGIRDCPRSHGFGFS